MKDELYLSIIPRIRVYEKKLITSKLFSRMLDLDKVDDVFKILSETSYGENVSDGINISNYDRVLFLEFRKLFKNLKELFRDNDLIEFFLKKYKYNNLKFMLKAKFLDADLEGKLFDIEGFDNDFIYSNIKSENFIYVPNEFNKLVKTVCEDFGDNRNPQNIDIIIDKAMFIELMKLSDKIKDEFLSKYLETLIDVFNVRTLFRFKKLNLDKKLFENVIVYGGNISLNVLKTIFLDSKENILNRLSTVNMFNNIKLGIENYLNTDSLSVLDRELDNYLIEHLKNAKIITTGLAPVIGYINAKENEIKNIRIILVGKINNVAPEFIGGRIRKSYV